MEGVSSSSVDPSYDENTEERETLDDANFDNQETSVRLALKETRTVRRFKILVLLALAISALAVALAVFFYVRNTEKAHFEDEFQDDATKVLASLGASLDATLAAADAFVVNVLSYARESNQTWPFVTIPDFAIRAGKVLRLSRAAVVVNLYPLVADRQRAAWEAYTATHNAWVEESIHIQTNDPTFNGPIVTNYENWDVIHGYDEYEKENAGIVGTDRRGPYLPWWQCAPVIAIDPVYNWDLMTSVDLSAVEALFRTHRVVVSVAYLIAYPNDTALVEENQAEAEWMSNFIDPDEEPNEPVSDIYYPLLEDALESFHVFDPDESRLPANNDTFKGIFAISIYWRDLLKDILPLDSNGIVVVMESPCNPTFTYQINGPRTVFLGAGDLHDTEYDNLERSSLVLDLRQFAIKDSLYSGIPVQHDYCPFRVRVFPSDTKRDYYTSSDSYIFPIVAVLIFVFTSTVFLLYDFWVERRQRLVLNAAVRSSAIVSSLFPSTVRDRIYTQEREKRNVTGNGKSKTRQGKTSKLPSLFRNSPFTNARMESPFEGLVPEGSDSASAPIADIFADTTVFFGDIAGFSAWSSEREPSQIFKLLETLYSAFDKIAENRKVFKVETISDRYVAVTGLPEAQIHHATTMVRFAADCRDKMNELTRQLESSLGPGTGDLRLQVGLHSGPVTAGVLRDKKARFQLFGYTVNTAARMESKGNPNRIHISERTAALLHEEGKGHWLIKRQDVIATQRRGIMQTYWVEPKRKAETVVSCQTDATDLSDVTHLGDYGPNIARNTMAILKDTPISNDKKERLVDWNLTILTELLRNVVDNRPAGLEESKHESADEVWGVLHEESESSFSNLFQELQDTLPVVLHDSEIVSQSSDLPPVVELQLRDYVTTLADNYNDWAFHNFEHCTHATMAAKKLASAAAAIPSSESATVTLDLSDTQEILADPLTQFAVVFSALIHDTSHPGVPNATLVEQKSPLAERYQNRSVAEQHSFDTAWKLLLDSRFADLRACICTIAAEYSQFRQIVVHSVLATDLFDPDLIHQRALRRDRAFGNQHQHGKQKNSEKALLVLEWISQGADLAHTMQHWRVYSKWNERLFLETHNAFQEGRLSSPGGGGRDPCDQWYTNELLFFDDIVIPLVEQMQECKLFGAFCDELWDFASNNRAEWESRGNEIVSGRVLTVGIVEE